MPARCENTQVRAASGQAPAPVSHRRSSMALPKGALRAAAVALAHIKMRSSSRRITAPIHSHTKAKGFSHPQSVHHGHRRAARCWAPPPLALQSLGAEGPETAPWPCQPPPPKPPLPPSFSESQGHWHTTTSSDPEADLPLSDNAPPHAGTGTDAARPPTHAGAGAARSPQRGAPGRGKEVQRCGVGTIGRIRRDP